MANDDFSSSLINSNLYIYEPLYMTAMNSDISQ